MRLSRKRISRDMRKVRENLEILDTFDLYVTRGIEDKIREWKMDYERSNMISFKGDG